MTDTDADPALADQLSKAGARRRAWRWTALGLLLFVVAASIVVFGFRNANNAGPVTLDDPDVDPALASVIDEIEAFQGHVAAYQRDVGTIDEAFSTEDGSIRDPVAYDADLTTAADALHSNVTESASTLEQIAAGPGSPAAAARELAAAPFLAAVRWAEAYPDAVRTDDRSRLTEIDEDIRIGMVELCGALRTGTGAERRTERICGDF